MRADHRLANAFGVAVRNNGNDRQKFSSVGRELATVIELDKQTRTFLKSNIARGVDFDGQLRWSIDATVGYTRRVITEITELHIFNTGRITNKQENKQMRRMTRIVYATVVSVIFGCFALLPQAQAVLPPPDGGYGPPDYGTGNTAEGEDALFNLNTGAFNTATGFRALHSDATGSFNTALGALNTATGLAALQSNTIGSNNTAMGAGALNFNTLGSDNTAVGHQALSDNSDSEKNTAMGAQALQNHTTGDVNTAVGFQALTSLTSGSANTAIGPGAGQNLTTGSNNVYIGNAVGSTSESGTIRIGSVVQNTQCFIAGIRDATINMSGVPVYVDFNHQLGTILSSRRFKKAIQPTDNCGGRSYRSTGIAS